jgi:hypothetical protein
LVGLKKPNLLFGSNQEKKIRKEQLYRTPTNLFTSKNIATEALSNIALIRQPRFAVSALTEAEKINSDIEGFYTETTPTPSEF